MKKIFLVLLFWGILGIAGLTEEISFSVMPTDEEVTLQKICNKDKIFTDIKNKTLSDLFMKKINVDEIKQEMLQRIGYLIAFAPDFEFRKMMDEGSWKLEDEGKYIIAYTLLQQQEKLAVDPVVKKNSIERQKKLLGRITFTFLRNQKNIEELQKIINSLIQEKKQ